MSVYQYNTLNGEEEDDMSCSVQVTLFCACSTLSCWSGLLYTWLISSHLPSLAAFSTAHSTWYKQAHNANQSSYGMDSWYNICIVNRIERITLNFTSLLADLMEHCTLCPTTCNHWYIDIHTKWYLMSHSQQVPPNHISSSANPNRYLTVGIWCRLLRGLTEAYNPAEVGGEKRG